MGKCCTWLYLNVLYYTLTGCSETFESENIRLVDGDSPTRGRVEICINNTFAVQCQPPLGNTAASDICTQLGYSPYGNAIHH